MKRPLPVLAVAIGTLLAMVGTPALAAPPPNPLLPASGSLAGHSGGELLGEELRQLFELPAGDNPLAGKGGSCFATADAKVLIVWTRDPAPTCPVPPGTLKPGTPTFLFAAYAECSNLEAVPFHGDTEEDQRQCAETALKDSLVPAIKAILVSIDSRRPTDIFSDRYRAVSPQMTANLPVDNSFVPPLPTSPPLTFVATGWVAMIPPLPPGEHTISVSVVLTDGTPLDSAVVVAGR